MQAERTPGKIYLDTLIAPYTGAMRNIHDSQTFLDWAKQIISLDDDYYYLLEALEDKDLETQKDSFVKILKNKLVTSISHEHGVEVNEATDFTPWELARFRDDDTARIYGEGVIVQFPH